MIASTSLCTSRPAIVAAGEFNGDHTGDRVCQISEVDIDVIGIGLGGGGIEHGPFISEGPDRFRF